MTKNDVTGILALLESEYPQSFARLDNEHMEAKSNLWAIEFANDDPNIVFCAVRALIRSGRQWAPSCGEIREKITELTAPEELPETAVLALISRAASNGIYHAEAEFKKLPAEIQEIIHSPNQLREWGKMDAQTFESVVGSALMRSYKNGIKRARDRAALPENMQDLIGGLSGKLALGGPRDA